MLLSPQQALATIEGCIGEFEELLQTIGIDAFCYMMSFLRPQDLFNMFQVSRKMNFLASHDSVWMRIYKRESREDLLIKRPSLDVCFKQMYKILKSWKWDNSPQKKAPTIQLYDDGRTASRTQTTGSNPAVLSASAFTKIKNSFEVRIQTRGVWIGVGVADMKFVLHHSSTLGTQTAGLNSAFFCQDSTLLQLNTCKENVHVAKRLEAGDRIKVEVNFDDNTIVYLRNGTFEGKLKSSVPMKEGEIFPCCNLSYGSTITLLMCP